MTDRVPVVIVTGAAGGLGRAMSVGLLEAGMRVVAADLERAQPALRELAAQAEQMNRAAALVTVCGDITVYADCERIAAAARERFASIDGLVNNAGLSVNLFSDRAQTAPPPFTEVPLDAWPAIVNTNINGTFYMTRAVIASMTAQRWGRIVNVTTSYGTMIKPGISPYGPTKAAIEAATAIWAQDLAGTGVTVNALLPGGAADTAMIPLVDVPDRSTLVPPHVMIAPLVWLLSDEAGATTGWRFVAKAWDVRQTSTWNLEHAGAQAAWR